MAKKIDRGVELQLNPYEYEQVVNGLTERHRKMQSEGFDDLARSLENLLVELGEYR